MAWDTATPIATATVRGILLVTVRYTDSQDPSKVQDDQYRPSAGDDDTWLRKFRDQRLADLNFKDAQQVTADALIAAVVLGVPLEPLTTKPSDRERAAWDAATRAVKIAEFLKAPQAERDPLIAAADALFQKRFLDGV